MLVVLSFIFAAVDPGVAVGTGVGGGTVIALAIVLVQQSNRKGEGWQDQVKQWKDIVESERQRANAAEAREQAVRSVLEDERRTTAQLRSEIYALQTRKDPPK